MATDAVYYGDEDLWGKYQKISLQEIVTNYMMSLDPDDYNSTVKRSQVLYQARRGMRELYYDVVRDIRAIKLELSDTLMVTLPQDFINYVRISWVDSDRKLIPMAVNDRIDISISYLQDAEYGVTFDDDGTILLANNDPVIATVSNPAPVTANSDLGSYSYYGFCGNNFQPNADMSKYFANGSYKIDKKRGLIVFSSDVFGKEIVLEYISDGMYVGDGETEADTGVHKFAETALMDYIHYALIKNRRNIPFNEKMRSRKEYYNSRRVAKRRISTINKDELLQIFKGDSKWIK
jgi:hypothetical protein